MSKTYLTTDGRYKVTKIGRPRKIYFTQRDGRPYFIQFGRRVHLDEVQRFIYPMMYEDEHGKVGVISGYHTVTNWHGYSVEILDGGEAVQIFTEELVEE